MVARLDQAAARLRRRLRGLDPTGDWDRRRLVRRCGDARSLRLGRLYSPSPNRPASSRRTRPRITHAPQRTCSNSAPWRFNTGMGEMGLAQRIGQPRVVARELIDCITETYQTFWRWSDAALDTAMLTGSCTVFGWRIHSSAEPNPRSLRNFPMQANGAEMMRLACCLATERGIEVCAPVHDALLICAPLDRLEATSSPCAPPWPRRRGSCSPASSCGPTARARRSSGIPIGTWTSAAVSCGSR